VSNVDVDEIRRQMAQIRREMHSDVSNVVEDVEEALVWRAPLRNHPYIAMGVGLVAGYFLVPRKKSKLQEARQALASVPTEDLAEFTPRLSAVARPAASRPAKPEPSKPIGRRLLSWGVGMAWPLVSQAVQSYAAMWVEDQLKQQMNPNRKPPADPFSPSSAGRPGGSHDAATARAPRRG
jgi:hypothetical protein